MALACRLVANTLASSATGFTKKPARLDRPGCSASTYTTPPVQMTYDLRRLRLVGAGP